MKKRVVILSVIFAVAVLLVISLSGCDFISDLFGSGKDDSPDYALIYYYMDGGNGERLTLSVEKGKMFSIPNIPQKTGYDLVGFFDSEIGGTKYANSRGESLSPYYDESDIALYAHWEAKEYDIVIFDAQEPNRELASISVCYDSKIQSFPMINDKIGYAFIGVYDGTDKTSSTCYSTSNDWLRDKKKFTFSEFNVSKNNEVILYAIYEPGEFYTIDFFDDNDILLARKAVPYGTKITSSDKNEYTPKLDSFNTEYRTLLGWSPEKDSTQPIDIEVNSNMNIYGVWNYSIKFELSNGEELKSGKTEVQGRLNAKIEIPTLYEKQGYTFVGWTIDSKFLEPYMPKAGGEATPVWRANDYTIVIYDARNPVVELVRLTATYDKELSSVPDLDTESGYRFTGLYNTSSKKDGICFFEKNSWKDNKKVFNFSEYALSDNGNVKLFAMYVRLFNINYNLNDGINSKDNPMVIREDEMLYLSDATKSGYHFMGWYTDENHTGERVTLLYVENSKDITLYAYYESSSYFTISKHIRERSVKIYKRNNYIWDIVNFTIDIPYETLKKAGYTKVNIVALVEMSEIPKRNNVVNRVEIKTPSDASLGYFESIHEGDWGYHRFEVKNVDISRLYISGSNYQIKVGYACFNKNYQDWNLGNVKVEITLVK